MPKNVGSNIRNVGCWPGDLDEIAWKHPKDSLLSAWLPAWLCWGLVKSKLTVSVCSTLINDQTFFFFLVSSSVPVLVPI